MVTIATERKLKQDKTLHQYLEAWLATKTVYFFPRNWEIDSDSKNVKCLLCKDATYAVNGKKATWSVTPFQRHVLKVHSVKESEQVEDF